MALPEQDITLAEAFDAVRRMHPKANPHTVRKFIVGVCIHGQHSGVIGYSLISEQALDTVLIGTRRLVTIASIERLVEAAQCGEAA